VTELATPSPNPAHDTGELPGLTLEERQLLSKMFSDPLSIPPEWKAWLVSYLEANPPVLPISQIHGFQAFAMHHAEVSPNQTYGGPVDTFQDLATVGPTLTELPAGSYILIFGCNYDASGGATGMMAPSINGAAADANDACLIVPVNVERFNLMRAIAKDLPDPSNTITMKYLCSQIGPAFQLRWLIALKYANL